MTAQNNSPSDKKIKYLLIIPFFYPHRGGSQKYAEEILAPMSKHHTNVQIDVLCYNTDNVEKYEFYRGFRVTRIPCWNVIPARFALPNPFALLLALIKLSRNNYDFVNTHIRFFDPTWWVWLYAKLIGAKSIFTGHVPSHPIHQNKFVEAAAKFADLVPAKLTLNKYDYKIFVNKASEKFFREKLGLQGKSHLVYIGVDTNYFKPRLPNTDRFIPKTRIKLQSEDILVTYMGRIIWTKGVGILYESIKDILGKIEHPNGPDSKVYFVMAGPGELEDELRQKVHKDGLEKQVFITGSLDYREVKDLLSYSDIFVNPSHHNEGLPNTLLEAGAGGCCIIATDNGGTKELIIDGITGILIPQKDQNALSEALINTINNPQEIRRLGNNIRKKTVKEFDWYALSEQFYSLLAEWK